MLAREQVVEAKALRSQSWSISAIARHSGVTRVTVRRYLSGEAVAGERARSVPDPLWGPCRSQFVLVSRRAT